MTEPYPVTAAEMAGIRDLPIPPCRRGTGRMRCHGDHVAQHIMQHIAARVAA